MEPIQSSFHCVAVLGAGVMGAQIAAHFANADIPVFLFDLPGKDGNLNQISNSAIANLAKISPSPLSTKLKATHIIAANYETDLAHLQKCDLVIEAISERMEWKVDLYQKILPFLGKNALLASNTSGLGIEALSLKLPESVRSHFLGVHFFNPPRYMSLVELIAQPKTDAAQMDKLETFLTSVLGKGVVRAKDTPNFIGNRLGVGSLLLTMHYAQVFGLDISTADALTGVPIGRPKSGTFRLADVVGLDTLSHVINTLTQNCKNDPWHGLYRVPAWCETLIANKCLGQKTGIGLYKKDGKNILALNLTTGQYEKQEGMIAPEVQKILSLKDPAKKLEELRACSHPQAQFLWCSLRDSFHYCAYHLEEVASNARDCDLAIRWGYGWTFGPFETWQAAGWTAVTKWMQEEISQGKTYTKSPLPAWVNNAEKGVHSATGSYSPTTKSFMPRSSLPVYQRQAYPDRLVSETADYGETLFSNTGVRLWTTGDKIGVISFVSKQHVVGDDVLDGIHESYKMAQSKGLKGVVIWQTEAPFSLGANLAQVVEKTKSKDFVFLEKMVKKFQDTSMLIKYAPLPTVVGMYGMALGGGCEFVMHAPHVVASLESYMGLVEVGVGLLPAGGGCKEFAIRAWQESRGNDAFNTIKGFFNHIAMANVSTSAHHAQEIGYLKNSDSVVFNQNEILNLAKQKVLQMGYFNYRPAHIMKAIPVCGRGATATLKAGLYNMLEGKFISEHDFLIGSYIADILCGGDVDAGTQVTENYLLDLERAHFVSLLKTEKTQARIEHMLQTGKPLRN